MAERIGRKWVSPVSPSKHVFLVRFVVCTRSYWLTQQSFTNLIILCRTVVAYKSHEVLKHDGVTLLCWWGNIHKCCVSDVVTSYSQSMYFTISVVIRAWILLKIHVLTYRGCINIDGEDVSTGQYRMQELQESSRCSRNLTFMSNPGSAFPSKDKFATLTRNLPHV